MNLNFELDQVLIPLEGPFLYLYPSAFPHSILKLTSINMGSIDQQSQISLLTIKSSILKSYQDKMLKIKTFEINLFLLLIICFFLFNLEPSESKKVKARLKRDNLGKSPIRGECPPSTFTDTWLYHNETNLCFLADRQGPCGEMMLFYQDPTNPNIGFCDCDDTIREDEREELLEYCNWKRPRIYWTPAKRCYSAFSRGPCEIGQWLIMEGSSPVCRTNLCNPQSKDEDEESIYFTFMYEEKCYQTFTYAYCKDKKFIILNADDSWCPICSKSPNKRFRISGERDALPGVVQVTCPHPKQCNAIQIECREGRRTYKNQYGPCEGYFDEMEEDW